MMLMFMLAGFILGGVVSLSFVSAVAEKTGLPLAEDRVYDRRL